MDDSNLYLPRDRAIINKEREQKEMSTQGKSITGAIIQASQTRAAAGVPPKEEIRIDIERSGEKIIVPENVSIQDALNALTRKAEEEEQVVAVEEVFEMNPLEGALAFHEALTQKFNWVSMETVPGGIFMPDQKPVYVNIPVSKDTSVQIPVGRLKIPGVDGWLHAGWKIARGRPMFTMTANIKGKHKYIVQEIGNLVKKIGRERSIYKGKAIKASFPDLQCATSLEDFFPEFMDLTSVDENSLIFSDELQQLINVTLFTPIEKTEACRKHGLSLKRGILLEGPFGVGKCLAKNTPVLMFNGTIKMVQDIKDGEMLMGPDSTPRKVLSTTSGREKMYRVTPRKGDPYVVNASHILSLKISSEWSAGSYGKHGDIVNMNVEEFSKLRPFVRQGLAGWRTGVDFPHKDVKLDPYFVGLWLGDGDSRNPAITTEDYEIKEYIQEVAGAYNLAIREHQPSGDNNKSMTYHITAGNVGGEKGVNPVRSSLQEYGLLQNKHIPNDYKVNDRGTRLRLLAGLVDSDGHVINNTIEIATKFDALAEDILYLSRSLGLAAYKKRKIVTWHDGRELPYWRIFISGDLTEVPTRLAHKQFDERKQKKSVLVTRLEVEELPEDDYYGFSIDGDRLFMLGDFTVTHNTLTAHVTAKKCVNNGWTFIYIRSVDDLAEAIEFARGYQPAVVFGEDLDQVLDNEDRDEAVNSILNTIDGIDAKGTEIIVVLTTNNVQDISQAMLRPERLDAVIPVRAPDAAAVQRLIHTFAKGNLNENEDLTQIGKLLDGYIPASIHEVVERAKLAAIARTGTEAKISGQDLVMAAKSMIEHLKLLKPAPVDDRSDIELAADILGKHLKDTITVTQVQTAMERARSIVGAEVFTGQQQKSDKVLDTNNGS